MSFIQGITLEFIQLFTDIFIFITGFALAYLALRAYKKSNNARILFFSIGFLFIALAGLIEGRIIASPSLMFASSITGYMFILLGFFTQKSKMKIYLNLLSGILIFVIMFVIIGPVASDISGVNTLYILTTLLSLAIALLFINSYRKSGNKTSIIFFIGFMILFLSEILFFTQYDLDIAHMLKFPAFLALSYVLLNESRRGSLWSDIHPVKEDMLSIQSLGKGKYSLSNGESYLSDSSSSLHPYDIFADEVYHGKEGLCFSKVYPDRVREITALKRTPIVWLTGTDYAGGINPQKYSTISELTSRYIHESKNSIILLDGIEYLIENNTFEQIVRLVEDMKNDISKSNSNMIVTIDTKTLKPEEKAILQKTLKSL